MKSILLEKNPEKIINDFYNDFNIIPQNYSCNDITGKYISDNGNYIKIGEGIDSRSAVEARLKIKIL